MNNPPRKRFLALLLSLSMVFGLMSTAFAAEPAAMTADLKSQIAVNDTASDGIDPEEWVTVIVELESNTTLDEEEFVEEYRSSSLGFSVDTSVAAYRATLVEEQTEIQSQIAAMVPKAQFRYHYTNLLNGFAAKVQYKDIAAIESLAGVASVFMTQTYDYSDSWEEDEEILEFVSLEEYYATYGGDGIDLADGIYTETSVFSDIGSIDQMGLQTAWDAGYTGAGKVAGIFDSSLRYTHELFQYMDPDVKEAGENGELSNYKTQANLLAAINNNWDTINLSDSGWGSWFHQRPNEETGFSEEVQADIKAGKFWISDKVPFAVDYMDGDLEVWDGDTSSHGTHVSGITAGNAGPLDESLPVSYNNTNGVLGAAYDAQIMFFKVFSEYDDFGQESDEAVFAALDDAVTLGVNSFNLSLGIPNGFTTMNTYAQHGYQMAYNRAAAAGISIAVSAGNDARDNHPGALVNGYTTVLPNSSKVGFSGSLLGPMTVASAQGTGYKYVTHYDYDTVVFVNADGEAVEGLPTAKGVQIYDQPLSATLTGSYEVVDCGDGSADAILAATKAESLEGALTGKVALVNRTYGYLPYDENGIVIAQENAYKAGATAVIACFTYYNSYFGSGSLWTGENGEYVPVAGAFTAAAVYAPAQNYLAGEDAKLFVSFGTDEADITTDRTIADNGPSGFTSWGVTEALKLKPDIMTPGGNILSAGAASDTALAIKSGTSMASPNMAGAFLLVQQYVDANLKTFGVQKGTQEYTNLVNQLVASTATVYTAGTSDLYFSPRRQGAGMADIAEAVNSKVVLYNGVKYNAYTGEASRTKVELGDKLENTFEISFYLKNYDSTGRTFDVLACLQTDATTTSGDRNILVGVNSNGTDIDAISDAVMTVTAANGAEVTKASDNINRYDSTARPTSIYVKGNTEAKITVTVELDEETMAAYDEIYPNGMFLEGFVFFESADEDVNIPFMGFRGDWTAAPIFDLATAYDDISELETTDLDYPLFYTTTLNTLVPNGEGTAEIVLGANGYDGKGAWPGYDYTNANGVNKIRSYLQEKRENGDLSADFAAFSPNNDNYADLVYADLALLRNAKALCVVITDAEGNVVTTIGPEYEYFESLASDGNGTQQVAATYGTKYLRNMAWDGKDADGKLVEDGQYYYTVLAMTEYEYFNSGLQGTDAKDAVDDEAVLAALLASETADSITMAVKVDTTAPVIGSQFIGTTADDEQVWWVTVTDDAGIQAIGWYYDGELLEITKVNGGTTVAAGWVLEEGQELGKLSVCAIDYALNECEIVDAVEAGCKITPATSSVTTNSSTNLTVSGLEEGEHTYQWYACDDCGNDATAIEGATSATYAASAAEAGTYYFYCVVDGQLTSNIAMVTVTSGSSGGSSSGGSSSGSSSSGGSTSSGSTSGTTTPSSGSTSGTTPAETKDPTFTDVPATHWASSSVENMAAAGLVTGVGDGTTFAPTDNTTRAMIVTILYRMAGSPAVSGTSAFTDVADGQWYTDAIVWGTENGIVNGYDNGAFGVNDLVTREQLAAFLFRYAKATAVEGDLSSFADADSVSAWAAEAMTWAVSKGLITGKPGNLLDPQGYASRAEAAVVLDRFLNK